MAEAEKEKRRKCFVSYYSGDKVIADNFVSNFSDVFIPKVIGISSRGDLINSDNSEYVISIIRSDYIGDSTVTICLIGTCTHGRRFVDWELKASLRAGGDSLPNGLIGILLPGMTSGNLPGRFKENYKEDDGYAIYRAYPDSKDQLRGWIEDAYARRSNRNHLISNSRDTMRYNGKCLVHQETH